MNFNSETFTGMLNKDLQYRVNDTLVTRFRKDVLKQTALKKFLGSPKDQAVLHDRAIDEFVKLNEDVQNIQFSPEFDTDPIIRTWKEMLAKAFTMGEDQSTELTLSACATVGYCGPGSSLGASDTTFYTKMFDSTLATTDLGLLAYYQHRIGSTRWQDAELIRLLKHAPQLVRGGSITTVPKSSGKRRTIEKVPTLNMFYQLGAKVVLESILKRSCNIDLSVQQDLNRTMARLGSLTGGLSTLDLKNASDMISVQLCKRILPRPIFELLMLIRSSEASVGKDVFIKLNMMSTMGTGFTFPLMTLLLATLVRSIYFHLGVKYSCGENVGVFGDDIICVTEAYQLVTEYLQKAGLVVNLEKSFSQGPFRESCGGDYFDGHDVRGIYLKEINYEDQLYSAFNRLHFWALRHHVSLDNTLVYLKSLAKFQPVPRHAGASEGFIVAQSQLACPKRDQNGALKYRATRSVSSRRRVDGLNANFDGAVICAIGGYIRNNQVDVRSDTRRLRVVKLVTPHWDYTVDPELPSALDLGASWISLLS